MNHLNNKQVFSQNLRHYMKLNKKNRNQICQDLNFRYSTFADWVNGNAYPRIDKIEKLANYFAIQKSDLIEDKSVLLDKTQKLLDYMKEYKLDHVYILPLYAKLVFENQKLSDKYIVGYLASSDSQIKKEDSENYFYYQVPDQSLNSKFNKGDYILIHKQQILTNNDIAVVFINGKVVIGKYQENDSLLILSPLSTSSSQEVQIVPKQQCTIIGKAVGYFANL